MESVDECLIGAALYGDHFDDEQIREWFADEEMAYYHLHASAQMRPEYEVLDKLTLFRHIRGLHFHTCLGIGSGTGRDIEPLAQQVDNFLIVEPCENFWRSSIGGKPAVFQRPNLRGRIDYATNSIDLIASIGVLHHIPNVGDILAELHRVMRSGGYCLLREPIVSMGDWRRPRRGLTKNERGIPLGWLRSTLERIGFITDNETFCNFAPLPVLCHKFGLLPYNYKMTTYLDLFASWLTQLNVHYNRTKVIQKISPATITMVLRKK